MSRLGEWWERKKDEPLFETDNFAVFVLVLGIVSIWMTIAMILIGLLVIYGLIALLDAIG